MEREFLGQPAVARGALRRRELDGRRGARRRQARRAARPRRGGAAQLRQHDARGDQPAAHRPAVRPAVRAPRPRRSGTWRARAARTSAMHFVGNPMIDTLLANLDKFDAAAARGRPRPRRPSTSSPPCTGPPTSTRRSAAAELVRALHEVAAELDVIIPLHPRGRATLTAAGLLDVAADPRRGPARLHRVHVAGARRRGDRHRFGRRAGGDYAAARALPHPPAEHRAADHHHQRLQPARHPRRAGRRGAQGLRRRPVRGRAARRCGTARPGRGSPGSSPPGCAAAPRGSR